MTEPLLRVYDPIATSDGGPLTAAGGRRIDLSLEGLDWALDTLGLDGLRALRMLLTELSTVTLPDGAQTLGWPRFSGAWLQAQGMPRNQAARAAASLVRSGLVVPYTTRPGQGARGSQGAALALHLVSTGAAPASLPPPHRRGRSVSPDSGVTGKTGWRPVSPSSGITGKRPTDPVSPDSGETAEGANLWDSSPFPQNPVDRGTSLTSSEVSKETTSGGLLHEELTDLVLSAARVNLPKLRSQLAEIANNDLATNWEQFKNAGVISVDGFVDTCLNLLTGTTDVSEWLSAAGVRPAATADAAARVTTTLVIALRYPARSLPAMLGKAMSTDWVPRENEATQRLAAVCRNIIANPPRAIARESTPDRHSNEPANVDGQPHDVDDHLDSIEPAAFDALLEQAIAQDEYWRTNVGQLRRNRGLAKGVIAIYLERAEGRTA